MRERVTFFGTLARMTYAEIAINLLGWGIIIGGLLGLYIAG